MCCLIVFQLSQNLCLHQTHTHTHEKTAPQDFLFLFFLLSTQAIYLPRMRNYPPRMTSIISLMRLDETRSASPLRLMSETAAASSGDLARRCLGVGRRLLRQTAGLPLSSLSHCWESCEQPRPAGRRYRASTHRRTQSHTHTKNVSF